MTKQTLRQFALSLACLGLTLSALLSMAQSSPTGPRRMSTLPHRSQAANRRVQTFPPGSPSYTFSFLDYPQAPDTTATGINKNFEVVGAYGSTVPQFDGGNGFLLEVGEKKGAISESFQTVNFPGEPAEQFAGSINDSGQIAGNYLDSSGAGHGYEWSAGTFTEIDVSFPGATGTFAWGINNSGVIVGGWSSSSVLSDGFELDGGVYTSFAYPAATQTLAYKINNSGDIVGYYDDASGVVHGFLLSGGTYTSIDPPGSVGTYATGINNAGDIVGLYCTTSECITNQNSAQGFLLSKGVYTTINVPGASSTALFGINDNGVIVGSYSNCSGGSGLAHAFVATP
jgi:uncharacterized membrane protein